MSTLLADRLRDLGIVTPDRHAALAGVQATPWWLAILLAIAAWIAALIIMGSFFGPLLALGDGPLTRAFGGGVLLGAALWLFRRAGPFFEQMALAFSLAGQGLLASAVLDGDAAWLQDADRLALTLLLIASALLVPRTSAAQRTVCVLIVLACLGYLIGWGMPLALYGIVLTAWPPVFGSVASTGPVMPWPGTSSRSLMGLLSRRSAWHPTAALISVRSRQSCSVPHATPPCRSCMPPVRHRSGWPASFG
jgi:hypothetical protein